MEGYLAFFSIEAEQRQFLERSLKRPERSVVDC